MFRNQGTACPQTFCRAHFLHEEQASKAPFGEYLLLAAASVVLVARTSVKFFSVTHTNRHTHTNNPETRINRIKLNTNTNSQYNKQTNKTIHMFKQTHVLVWKGIWVSFFIVKSSIKPMGSVYETTYD